jgi:agmatine/peptidylarginine deiminase
MMKNSEKYRNYVPYPFWAMDQEFFFKYANSLMMNKRILVATFDQEDLEKYNEEALAVYQSALPDYEVIPIEATIQTNAGGAINCSSKEIPDVTKMVTV